MNPLYEECTMGDLLVRSIERGGDRIAFVSRGRETSYREFGALLSKMEQVFDRYGIHRGDGIACLSSNLMEAFLITAVGYLLGVRITNLHPLASLDDHVFIVQDSGVKALFFEPTAYGKRAMDIVARASARLLSLGPFEEADDVMALAETCEAARTLVSTSHVDDVCWIIYTGGTTGRPKGVVHTHRTHLAMTMAELSEWQWPARPTFLAITPISHGAGGCIMPVLLKSGTVVMETGFSEAKFFEVVKRRRVSATFLVPTMIYKLLDHAAEHDVSLKTMELVIYGAAPMAAARLREAVRIFGPVFMQLYGQSEAPNCVTVLRQCDHVDAPTQRLSSCGRPIFTSRVALLDGEGQVVKRGETGEICVRGPLVMREYWNRPDETETAFRHGWLHTGDLAKEDQDGYLYIVGRSKDMIITGGFNVYPAEIEDVLTGHPAVSAAAIIGVADDKWGEAVKAVVVLRPGHLVSDIELMAVVRGAKGAVYAPKSVDFVEELPLTSLGKPDKKVLRQRYENRSIRLGAKQ
jgi:fatty-acyl-CoA synthase